MFKPVGFGSKTPRFNKKNDSTPGPGHYNPKPVENRPQGGTFSKADRFPKPLIHDTGTQKNAINNNSDILQESDSLKKSLSKSLNDLVNKIKPKGEYQQTALAIITSDGAVCMAFHQPKEIAIHKDTAFRIGSMSKFFTGILVNRLEIETDRPLRQISLGDVFNESELNRIFVQEDIQKASTLTLDDLMNQTTGIRGEEKNDKEFSLNQRLEESDQEELPLTSELLAATDKGLKLGINEIKGKFQYSNFNATLAGAILERVYKQPFHLLMKDYIFDVIGMSHSTYDIPEESHRATSINKDGSFYNSTQYSNSRFFDSSSHIWTSISDLVLFFKYLFKNPELKTPIIKGVQEGLYYSGFSKINTIDGRSTIGVDGGRDEMGSSAHQDEQGNTIIAIGTGGAGDMDAMTQKMAELMRMTPFSGDPTRKNLW